MSISKQIYNPTLSVDCVIFGFDSKSLKILLIEQTKNIYKLPGSLVVKNEDLDVYANKVLMELTGLKNVYLKQFFTFGAPNRISEAGDILWIEKKYGVKANRIVSTAYYSLIKIDQSDTGLLEKEHNAQWLNVAEIKELAFDHLKILKKGLETLRTELKFNPIVCFELLPKKFSLREIQNIYEAIQGVLYDNRNFRKKLMGAKYIIPTKEKQKLVAHKPAILYKFDKKIYESTFKETNLFNL